MFPEQPPIPGYEPIRPLGINLGVVYLARHSSSGMLVVLKVWRLEFAGHARDLHAPSARLHHPNIIRVLEMAEFEGSYFCALEYVERTLADKMRERPLPDGEVVRLAHAIGSALQYALDRGLIPLDLSPRSILLADGNVPKLSAFCASETPDKFRNMPAIARLPPEWVSANDTGGEASQVYRMGVLMYELLTATSPCAADGIVATAMRVLHEMPVPPRKVNPGVGRRLAAICMKCLAKQPAARYHSLRDLLHELASLKSR